MDRRGFLTRIGGGLLAVPFVLKATACGGDDDGGTPDSGGGGESFVAMNDMAADGSGHTQTFTVFCAQLDDNGATFTATGSGHTHSVMLTMEQLAMVANGDTVMVQTTSLHDHTWVIAKPAASC